MFKSFCDRIWRMLHNDVNGLEIDNKGNNTESIQTVEIPPRIRVEIAINREILTHDGIR